MTTLTTMVYHNLDFLAILEVLLMLGVAMLNILSGRRQRDPGG